MAPTPASGGKVGCECPVSLFLPGELWDSPAPHRLLRQWQQRSREPLGAAGTHTFHVEARTRLKSLEKAESWL